MKNKYNDFDIYSFLSDYDISYKESGTNIGRNWIGIDECIFCGATNYHLGLHKKSKTVSCFVCGKSGTLFTFIKTKLNLNNSKVKEIIKKYLNTSIVFEEIKSGSDVIFPSNMQSKIPRTAYYYLKNRGFNPFKLIQEYNIKFTKSFSLAKHNGIIQDFSYRIIIPIYENNKIVSYTGRDYTNKADPRYRHPELSLCIKAPADTMYIPSKIENKAIIVEGITDVWKMGAETISGQGVKFTKNQINQIAKLNLKRIAILLDAGAEKNSEKLANNLYGLIPDIRIGFLNKDDPGSLSEQEAFNFKRKLLYW